MDFRPEIFKHFVQQLRMVVDVEIEKQNDPGNRPTRDFEDMAFELMTMVRDDIMKNIPSWKRISRGLPGGINIPETFDNCIIRDGYYLDKFDLDKLPKAETLTIK